MDSGQSSPGEGTCSVALSDNLDVTNRQCHPKPSYLFQTNMQVDIFIEKMNCATIPDFLKS